MSDNDLTARVRWAVVDANAFGRGKVQLDQVEGLANELKGADVEVVIPEVVLWEWAQHAHADLAAHYDSLRASTKTLRGSRIAGAFPAVVDRFNVPEVTVEQVLEHLTRLLSGLDNVSVLPATPVAALAGLRAQVLMQGPGERKSGVKTGAADMAWVHDALALAEHDSTRLVLLTADSDVDAAIAHLGLQLPVRYARRNELVAALRGLVPAPASELALNLARHVAANLPASIGSIGRAGKLDDLAAVIDDTLLEFLTSELVLAASVTEITGIAAVGDLKTTRPSDGPVGSLVTASLTLIANISATVWHPLPDEHEHLASRQFDDVAIEVPVSGYLVESDVQELRAAAPARFSGYLPRYDSISEGKDALAIALAAAPGFPDSGWWRELLDDSIPPDAPEGLEGLDWTRNDLMDTEQRWEIAFVVHGHGAPVIIEADRYELVRMKRSQIFSVRGHFGTREVDGPTAVAAAIVGWLLAP
ncbi:hypothetical protein CTKZ_17410 [Cellulomonas algicola]|uniref:Uncharacterized protein n=1 Tax=Cellulomonas algicola TaxID=2071633 RepID=A0A401UZR2_9CELL|nr:hypothetical protein [Cellulomonas algicola]GCD20179.1 hypothetical protein CTKZ_17410 [Cellulomonas algicola]